MACRRPHAAVGLAQAGHYDGGLGAGRRLEPAQRFVGVAVAQQIAQFPGQLGDVITERKVEPAPLEHDGHRDSR